MKFDVDEETMDIIVEVLKALNIPNDHDNRTKFISTSLNVGISYICQGIGLYESVKQIFPELSEVAITEEQATEESREEHAPDKCPKCGKRVLWNGKLWACNCRTYEVSPKPDTICKHCLEVVEPFHFYWRCKCNRYDCAPDAPFDPTRPGEGPLTKLANEGWTNAFPES